MTFSMSFFEVSAQLIPVLFLAMVVEDRLQPDKDERPGDRVSRSWLLAMLVIGEIIALSVVAGGLQPSKGTGSIVAGAMLFSAFLLALPVFEGELSAERSQLERLGHASAGFLVILVVVGTLIAMQLS